MSENGLFILVGPEMQLHDILWAVHDGKNHGRSEGEENIGVFPVKVGGWGRAMHGGLRVSLVHIRTFVRGVRLVNPSDCTSYVTKPERSIPWLLTEPERFLRYCC